MTRLTAVDLLFLSLLVSSHSFLGMGGRHASYERGWCPAGCQIPSTFTRSLLWLSYRHLPEDPWQAVEICYGYLFHQWDLCGILHDAVSWPESTCP